MSGLVSTDKEDFKFYVKKVTINQHSAISIGECHNTV